MNKRVPLYGQKGCDMLRDMYKAIMVSLSCMRC